MSARFYRNPTWDKALRAACFVRLLAKGIDHSLGAFRAPPSRKAIVAPTRTYSEVP